MIVIGLGPGRSGTSSFAELLSRQDDALCFHELNPACVRAAATPRPIRNTIEEFSRILDGGPPSELTADLTRAETIAAYDRLCTMPRVAVIGDCAFYYLGYVADILAVSDRVRFVCLSRDRDQVIASFLAKTALQRWRSKALVDRLDALVCGKPYYRARNHWMAHDGSVWLPDPVWDKCFPKVAADSREAAVAAYVDGYIAEAEALAAAHPAVFRVVPLASLNDPEGQRALLSFCGIAEDRQRTGPVHANRGPRAG